MNGWGVAIGLIATMIVIASAIMFEVVMEAKKGGDIECYRLRVVLVVCVGDRATRRTDGETSGGKASERIWKPGATAPRVILDVASLMKAEEKKRERNVDASRRMRYDGSEAGKKGGEAPRWDT